MAKSEDKFRRRKRKFHHSKYVGPEEKFENDFNSSCLGRKRRLVNSVARKIVQKVDKF